jgi:hypothetical protein
VASSLKSLTSPPKSPVFADTIPEYEAKDNKKATKTTTRKRMPTLASETNLRRRKRNKAQNDGYKPTSPVTTRKMATMKKLASAQSSLSRKSLLFPITQSCFPGLALIDQHINDDLVHPHIPIDELQRVAKETCGIPPYGGDQGAASS